MANALIKHAGKLPQELYKSLTWDRGTEMAGHKRFTIATDIAVYFCDPKHPWQRLQREYERAVETLSLRSLLNVGPIGPMCRGDCATERGASQKQDFNRRCS